MWAGILYDPLALQESKDLSDSFRGLGDLEDAYDAACRNGLNAQAGSSRMIRWAEALFDIAKRGLSRWQAEALPLLIPLEKQIDSGESPAARQRRAFVDAQNPKAFLSAIRY